MQKVWILFKFGYRKKSKRLDFFRHTFSSIYKNHFSNWVYEELVGHTHPGVNGVYMHPMDGDMDGVPALLDSLLDERLSLGRAKRMLLSNGQTK